uniref:Uncharacterized protein n=1 Tax=Timema genevievae TaxID=629358 RepID=A0A7R9PJK7_TIMGE|nr:unnamed protein product [Timema genevievae]
MTQFKVCVVPLMLLQQIDRYSRQYQRASLAPQAGDKATVPSSYPKKGSNTRCNKEITICLRTLEHHNSQVLTMECIVSGRVEDGRQHSWLNLLDCDNAAFLACAGPSATEKNQRDAIHRGQLITYYKWPATRYIAGNLSLIISGPVSRPHKKHIF